MKDMLVRLRQQITELEAPGTKRERHRDHLEELMGERTAELKALNWRLREQITEYKRVMEALRESEEFRSSLLANSPHPIEVVSPDTSLRYVNPALEKLTGFTSTELIGKKPPYPYWTEETLLRISGDFEGAVTKGIERVEELFQRKNGERFWVEITSGPIIYNGEPKYYLANWVDITERKQAEEALQAEKNKLQSVIDAIEYSLTIMDKDYNIIYQSQPSIITGDYYLGEKCYRVYEGRDKVCHGCPVEKAFKDGKFHTAERRIVMPSGEAQFLENTACPVRDAEGKIVSCLEVTRDITERKQAEEALRESEYYLRKAQQTAHFGSWILDVKTNRVEFSDEMFNILGITKEQFVGTPEYTNSLVKPEDRARVRECYEDLLIRHKPTSMEYSIIHPDGSVRHLWGNGDVELDEKGNLQRLVGTVLDITERKQAEEALERTSKDLQLVNLVNNMANQGYSLSRILQLVVQETKKIFSCNGATFYEISEDKKYLIMQNFNLPQTLASQIEKLIGVKIPPVRIRLREGCLYLKALQAGKPQLINDPETIRGLMAECTANKLVKKLVPRIHQLLGIASVMQTPLISEGEVIGLLDISRKRPFTGSELERFATIAQQLLLIIKRRRAEETLQAEKNKLQSVIDAIEHGLSIVDRDYDILYQSEPSRMTGGYHPGEKCYRVYEGQDRVCDGCPVEQAFRDGKPHTSERRVVAYSGEVLFLENTASPIRDAEGRIVSCLEVTRNITEHKRAESQERRLQRELNRASRLAAVGELAAGVAHEINNPLTGILGFSQRLLRRSTDGEVRRDLERIHNEAQRAAEVVKNLLAFARRREPKKEYADIGDILRMTLDLRTYELKTGNIEVALDLAPDLCEVMVDIHQIQEVFLNIILNAEQAMVEAHSGGKLTIKTERVEGYIRISFTDDGSGVPAEKLDRLFDPFFTTRGERGGTGLGLSLCHGIVTDHGGKIYARSKAGKGAIFFVELPCPRLAPVLPAHVGNCA